MFLNNEKSSVCIQIVIILCTAQGWHSWTSLDFCLQLSMLTTERESIKLLSMSTAGRHTVDRAPKGK